MLCIGLLIIFHCQPQAAPKAPASTFCQIAQPVRPSRQDTRETQVQAAREFAKWKSACGKKP